MPTDLEGTVKHGDFPRWLAALKALPELEPASVDLLATVRIGEAGQCSEQQRQQLHDLLMVLHPWRKGPLELFGLTIATEWRSDWKWERVKPHISSLHGRMVLDVGCGNGYHCWRMAGEGASLVIGIDPYLLYNLQYWAMRRFLSNTPVYVLPLALEELPAGLQAFDTVFSMGVLYHRRSPLDHLLSLRNCLRAGGELVLETLVIDGEDGMTLVPSARYARMPNVWFLPTCNTLASWLEKSGYIDVRLIDVNTTTIEEQRTTSWMTFESLQEALDPANSNLTVEGLPAPKRAVFVARKPW